ncbi:hypothetical protein IC617_07700 [Neiella sp. HB171785]|uniref:Tetratricopeptide repeat protein n=1 Tax=Neiella litorisoli TaxID=2771431 RepID=A0A8J6R2Q6_9GAMM|nr:hypothetical protein [Neiella litorisoli]MBD1389305.1 hypothetical protein [Neiella litorisoli]
MKRVHLAIACMGLALCNAVQASGSEVESSLSITEQLHQKALSMKKKREGKQRMPIYQPQNDKFSQYNRQIRQLVELSENALTDDLNELNDIYESIESWNSSRSKIRPIRQSYISYGMNVYTTEIKGLDERVTKYRISIQHFLLQQQNKTDEIISLLLGEYQTIEELPQLFRHHLAAAYAKLNRYDKAIDVLSLFDYEDESVKPYTVRMLAMAYVGNGQSQKAIDLIELRAKHFGTTDKLLQLKYGVLLEIGDMAAAEEVAEQLSSSNAMPKSLARGTTSIAWSPILDYI